MTFQTIDNPVFDFVIPKNSNIYSKFDPAEVDRIADQLRLSIPDMRQDRPYDAQFLLWPLWKSTPPAHHSMQGNILSAIARSGVVPLVATSGREVGSTKINYFLIFDNQTS